jgi:hypothetical protein
VVVHRMEDKATDGLRVVGRVGPAREEAIPVAVLTYPLARIMTAGPGPGRHCVHGRSWEIAPRSARVFGNVR